MGLILKLLKLLYYQNICIIVVNMDIKYLFIIKGH